MNNELSVLARDVADDMVKNEGVDNVKAFDIATLLVIGQVIMFIINFFKDRDNSAVDIKRQAQRTNLIQRFIIKNRLKRYMRSNSDYYDTYYKYDDNILKSSLRKVGNADINKLESIMKEV